MSVDFAGPWSLVVPHFLETITDDVSGVAPPGWEKSIKRMKKDKGIDNPFALSWWMKKRGAKPAKDEDAADAVFDAEVQGALTILTAQGLPPMFAAAGRGETWAHVLLLDASAAPLLLEQR